MNQLTRNLLIPLSLILIIVGLVTGRFLLFIGLSIILLIFTALFYSGRKQRVRYWLQGYLTHLEENGNNPGTAIKSVQREFCETKYADEKFCSAEFKDIDGLVEGIIKREYKFERLLTTRDVEDILIYKKEVEKLKKEIVTVKQEIFN